MDEPKPFPELGRDSDTTHSRDELANLLKKDLLSELRLVEMASNKGNVV